MVKSVQQLQQQVSGKVLSREDPGYDQIRRGWDLTIDHYPAHILVPHNATDVAAGVRFAHESGLAVAVQSTGHGMLYPQRQGHRRDRSLCNRPCFAACLNMLRHTGGAIARIPADAGAIGNRDASVYLMIGGVVPDPAAFTNVKAYVQRYRTALQPYVRGGVWMNFMNGNGRGAQERIRETYLPEAYERLLALKTKYDPDNMFRFSYQLGS